MIDWKRKLTSRKLWAAICALATNLIIAFGGSSEEAVGCGRTGAYPRTGEAADTGH